MNFFEQLPGFSDFKKFVDSEVYVEAPDSWSVILTDICGSTEAIQAGKYRDVNTLGAASIAVVQTTIRSEKFPFVFGGDGATFLVPPTKVDDVKVALQKLISLAKTKFNLELRVGIITVADVHRAGHKLLVGKFKINHFNAIAVIKGGGLTWAEKEIKSKPEFYCVKPLADTLEVPVELSCRWQPIKSKKGTMLSILIQSRSDDLSAVSRVSSDLEAICEGDLEKSNPVQVPSLRYKGLVGALIDEYKFHQSHLSRTFPDRCFQILLCWWAFKLGLPAPFRAKSYKDELGSHSDYRKYDDLLRMVLDCSRKQATEISAVLKNSQERGEIYYGIHESSHALMTCLVESIQPGGHIHFIDGSDGGYAMAAKQLKLQITN